MLRQATSTAPSPPFQSIHGNRHWKIFGYRPPNTYPLFSRDTPRQFNRFPLRIRLLRALFAVLHARQNIYSSGSWQEGGWKLRNPKPIDHFRNLLLSVRGGGVISSHPQSSQPQKYLTFWATRVLTVDAARCLTKRSRDIPVEVPIRQRDSKRRTT